MANEKSDIEKKVENLSPGLMLKVEDRAFKILKTFRESGRINYKNPAEESAVKEAYEEIMREEVDADKTFYFRNPSKSRPQESEFYQV